MRTCQSCGLQNPDDRDFCECGEYLRWDPTGFVQAITPEMAQQAAEQAAAPASDPPAAPATPAAPAAATPAQPPQVTQAPSPAPPAPGNGHGNGHSHAPSPPPPAPPPGPGPAKTAVQSAVPAPQRSSVPDEPAPATVTLRAADRDAVHGVTLQVDVEPGQRERALALVRNQSGIVDNYELRIEGMPREWWSIFPDTVYLVPYGTSGTYEQEVEIHFHPPRSPEAYARIWNLKLVANSKARNSDIVTEPLQLGIHAYTETTTKVRPERVKGRRKADFGVAVENKANAPVTVALEGQDPDNELQFGFDTPPQTVEPGETMSSVMRVKPAKQIWIGRPVEKRFEVTTLTGEEAEERLAEAPVSTDAANQAAAGQRRRRWRIPGITPPHVYRPQVYQPNVSLGPGGINISKPQFRGPQVQAPQMGSANLNADMLKKKPGGGAAAPQMPLLPSQGVFRQKSWLPWWLIPVVIALAALIVFLLLLMPKNVVVPDVVGTKSAFEAEKKLDKANLKLAAQPKTKVVADKPPGTVIGQTPAAGKKVQKNSEVEILIAVGTGKVAVPKIVGLTAADADKALRAKGLTLGQASPQGTDPAKKISSQIPAAAEVVTKGTPVNIFYQDPKAAEAENKKNGGAGGAAGAGGGGGGGGGGGAAGAAAVVPAIAGAKLDAYAQTAASATLVPTVQRVFSAQPVGAVIATDPPAGTKVAGGAPVKVLVSAGFPEMAYDNGQDVLLVNGANGKKLPAIANGPNLEKDPTFSADGTHVAYIGGRRIFVANLAKPNAAPVALTSDLEQYTDPSWAPTPNVNILAMARAKGQDHDLCLGQITQNGMTPRCIVDPKINIGRAIHWSPDGKTILAFGVLNNGQLGTFGMVRWRSKKPFSPDPADWGQGKFVTDVSTVNHGVIDAAISPDGKRLALVSNLGQSFFSLFLAKPGDYMMAKAKPTKVPACKVTWRTDSLELAVVQADDACSQDVGSIARLPVDDPQSQTELAARGDNPSYQPLTIPTG
jgi:beta-lactam-binding protein with PASTA domain